MRIGASMNELDRQVDAAMARVLKAEGAARAAIMACEQEAQGILADARNGERRIAERASRRIAKIRAQMANRLAARLNDLANEPVTAEGDAPPEATTHPRLHHAVARVIDEMTGVSR